MLFELIDIVGVGEADAAVFQGMKVPVVGMLVEGDESVGFVSGMEDFAGTKVDLKNRRAPENGAGSRHFCHDVLSS